MKKNKKIQLESFEDGYELGKMKRTQIITTNRPLFTFYQEEGRIAFYEGCDILGYMEKGDSFLFSQGMGFEPGHEPYNDKRVIFCISRNALERLLRDYPLKSEK